MRGANYCAVNGKPCTLATPQRIFGSTATAFRYARPALRDRMPHVRRPARRSICGGGNCRGEGAAKVVSVEGHGKSSVPLVKEQRPPPPAGFPPNKFPGACAKDKQAKGEYEFDSSGFEEKF